MAEGICSEVNPDWCFTFSRFQSGTETSCRYFVSPKGVLESDLGRSIERIRVPEMTPEEIAELGRHCCCVISGRIAKAAIMAGGPKALKPPRSLGTLLKKMAATSLK
jgi:hypothetical protein